MQPWLMGMNNQWINDLWKAHLSDVIIQYILAKAMQQLFYLLHM